MFLTPLERAFRPLDDAVGELVFVLLLFHQSDHVPVRIAHEADPELVVGHPGCEQGSPERLGAARDDGRMHLFDALHLEVQHRVGAGRTVPLGRRQHQPDRAVCEEREIGPRTEQVLQAEHVTVVHERPFDVADDDGDLADGTDVV